MKISKMNNREKVLIFLSLLSALEAVPSIEKELSFKTTLADYPMGYSSASFAISNDVIYVVNGANVGNYVLKFDLNGTFLEQYPGWYNFPHDIIVGGEYKVNLGTHLCRVFSFEVNYG